MVKWIRNECHSNYYLTGHIYGNSNWLKWLYCNSHNKRNAKHYSTKRKHHRFNQLNLFDHKCNQNRKRRRNLFMVRRFRNECHGHHYLTGHLYCNGNRFQRLYGNSYNKYNTKYHATKRKHHRFNKLNLFDNKCNQNGKWWQYLSMVKWLRYECHSNDYLTGYLYGNSDRF